MSYQATGYPSCYARLDRGPTRVSESIQEQKMELHGEEWLDWKDYAKRYVLYIILWMRIIIFHNKLEKLLWAYLL
jgi:hypothetical protein